MNLTTLKKKISRLAASGAVSAMLLVGMVSPAFAMDNQATKGTSVPCHTTSVEPLKGLVSMRCTHYNQNWDKCCSYMNTIFGSIKISCTYIERLGIIQQA